MNCDCCRNSPGIRIINNNCPQVLNTNSWSQISVPETITLPDCYSDIDNLVNVTVESKVIGSSFIITPSSNGIKNKEDTLLTGFKLLVQGVLKQQILYTSKSCYSEVSAINFNMPFCAFVMLPSNATPKDNYCIKICIEDVYATVLSPRKIFKSATLLVSAINIS